MIPSPRIIRLRLAMRWRLQRIAVSGRHLEPTRGLTAPAAQHIACMRLHMRSTWCTFGAQWIALMAQCGLLLF